MSKQLLTDSQHKQGKDTKNVFNGIGFAIEKAGLAAAFAKGLSGQAGLRTFCTPRAQKAARFISAKPLQSYKVGLKKFLCGLNEISCGLNEKISAETLLCFRGNVAAFPRKRCSVSAEIFSLSPHKIFLSPCFQSLKSYLKIL